MGYLERLLRTARPRCAFPWSTEDGGIIRWHTCVLPPGHREGHACACEPGETQAA